MINNEEEYEQSLSRVDEIMSLSGHEFILRRDELNQLVNEIEAYEEIHYPMDKND